uniref:Uncharacterized protein n=1 Tax=Bos mutus grunniens TaxID=30521 RepID=A0A8B9WUS6_BOSMU
MNQHLFFFVLPAQAYWKVRTKALSYADGRAWPQRPHLVRELLDAPLALPHALDRLHVTLLLGLQLVLQLPHPGLQLLQLLLAALEGDLLRLVQPVLQVLDGLLHVLLHALQVCTGVALHLLLHPQGLVAAARLRVQGGLQRVHHPQVVALGLLHLLILLYQLPLNLCLDLVELQLGRGASSFHKSHLFLILTFGPGGPQAHRMAESLLLQHSALAWTQSPCLSLSGRQEGAVTHIRDGLLGFLLGIPAP